MGYPTWRGKEANTEYGAWLYKATLSAAYEERAYRLARFFRAARWTRLGHN